LIYINVCQIRKYVANIFVIIIIIIIITIIIVVIVAFKVKSTVTKMKYRKAG